MCRSCLLVNSSLRCVLWSEEGKASVNDFIKMAAETINVHVIARRQASVNDFIIKAAAAALRSVPQANGYWTEDAIKFHSTIDVAFAAATPAGLGPFLLVHSVSLPFLTFYSLTLSYFLLVLFLSLIPSHPPSLSPSPALSLPLSLSLSLPPSRACSPPFPSPSLSLLLPRSLPAAAPLALTCDACSACPGTALV